jgi:hypothetical protein
MPCPSRLIVLRFGDSQRPSLLPGWDYYQAFLKDLAPETYARIGITFPGAALRLHKPAHELSLRYETETPGPRALDRQRSVTNTRLEHGAAVNPSAR